MRRIRAPKKDEDRLKNANSIAFPEEAMDDDEEDVEPDELAPIDLPITDVLDLHSFRPAEVKNVVREYLDAAYGKGLRRLRIIHGRGIGAQRQMVRTLLARDPRVADFGDAPAEAGGWGATWLEMR
jgi:dsDNA-specific endonuclease/ATPase MutS2